MIFPNDAIIRVKVRTENEADRSDLERVRSFINGAKTGIDWLNHKGRGKAASPSEYEEGFRHALDAIGGYLEDIDEEKTPA